MLARRSSGAAGLFCLQEVGTEERALRPKGRQNPPGVQGGAAGALRAHKAGGGGLWPRPLLWFCGPFGPAKRRRLRTPTAPAYPTPSAPLSALRRRPRGRREARRGPMGGGGVWRRGGPMGRPASACRKTPGGSGAAMQFAKVALRRPVGPSWRSLAHWASASLLPPLAALGFAPRRL